MAHLPAIDQGLTPPSLFTTTTGTASPATLFERDAEPIDPEKEKLALADDGKFAHEPSLGRLAEKKGGSPRSDVPDRDADEGADDDVVVLDTAESPPDPNAVPFEWDGPDDPENPKNWSKSRKWVLTALVSGYAFLGPASSSMVAVAADPIAADLHFPVQTRHGQVELAMAMSVFVLGSAFGPLFFGPLSEIYGRARTLQLANLFFLLCTIACALAPTPSALLAFRFLAGIGGGAPSAISGAILGDTWRPHERGTAVSLYALFPLLGPAVGPVVAAGILQGGLDWRWIFWVVAIADGAVQVVGLAYLRETFAPLLLVRRARRRGIDLSDPRYAEPLAKLTGGRPYRGPKQTWRWILGRALVRPFTIFFQEPIVQLFGVYLAFCFGVMYLVTYTIPIIYVSIYHQSPLDQGLHYIAFGTGLVLASQINALVIDRVYNALVKRHGGVAKPEYRLPSMVHGTLCLPAGILILGLTARADVPWIAPDIGIALIGAGAVFVAMPLTTYLIDVFTLHAASALAAVSCLRNLAGFAFPLFAPALYGIGADGRFHGGGLGLRGGSGVLCAVAVMLGCPAPWIFYFYGERIRAWSKRSVTSSAAHGGGH